MTPFARLPAVLRAVLLLALAALLVTGLGDAATGRESLRLAGDRDEAAEDLAAAILGDQPPSAIFRTSGGIPTELELAAIGAAAERSPLLVEVPASGPTLSLEPPEHPVVGRAAAVRLTIHTAPGDSVVARLLGTGGAVLDSTLVFADDHGVGRGAFRVRPGSPGWTEWRVALEGTGVATNGSDGARGTGPDGDPEADFGRAEDSGAAERTAAWVAPGGAPRVLVVSGPPGWESRYIVRALEQSGAAVSLVQHLGRDNVVTAGGATAPWWERENLASQDVAILLAGADPSAEALESLAAHVATGRGALLAGGAAGHALSLAALGLADGAAATRAIPADSMRWSAPPEIAPLPAAEVEATTAPFSAPRLATTIAARGAEREPLFLLAALGRGRVGALGVGETWRWALEAGAAEEHRTFWRSVVDWLAAPAADSLGIRVSPPEAAAGATVTVEAAMDAAVTVEAATDGATGPPDGETAALSTLRRPDGSTERSGFPTTRFVAIDTGLHTLQVEGRPVAAMHATAADAAPAATLGRARLALVAEGSRGGALEPEAFRAAVREAGADGGLRWPWHALLFAGLALLATAEWSVRRLRGLR